MTNCHDAIDKLAEKFPEGWKWTGEYREARDGEPRWSEVWKTIFDQGNSAGAVFIMEKEPLKLKPCPFCGSSDVRDASGMSVSQLYCHDCGAHGPASRPHRLPQTFWNERPGEAEQCQPNDK